MHRTRYFAVILAVIAAAVLAGCCASPKPETAPTEAGKPQPEGTPAAAASGAKTGTVVVEIGNEKITLEEINAMIKEIPEQYQPMAEAHKDMFADSVINQKLLYNEAAKLNLDKDAAVQKQIEEARKEIIIKEYLRREVEEKAVVSDEDAKKYYEANKDKFKDAEKIKVSHILVETEAEANDVLAKLNGGADFAALAKEKSTCPSKEKGGELGLISKGQTVPEFENAAFALQAGQVSGIVKSQFGYHIIKVTEKQPEKVLSYDEVKDQLKQMLLADKQKERFEQILKDLKDKNKVIIHKDLLMPPAPKAEAAPAK